MGSFVSLYSVYSSFVLVQQLMLQCWYCWKDVDFLSSVTSELLLIFPLVSEAAVKQHNGETTVFLKIAIFLCFSNSHSSLISQANSCSPLLCMVSTRQRVLRSKHISFHVSRVNGQAVPNHSTSCMIKQCTVFCDAINSCLVVADTISYLFCLTLIQNSTNRYVGCDIKLLISMRLQGRP